MTQGTVSEYATGVFVGVLLEDMVTTVQRTKKLYCDVKLPFFSEEHNHPLTMVPLWAMSLPLKKDDKVMVQFWQGDLTKPVLFCNPSEIPKGFYTQFEIPDFVSGGNISHFDAKPTVGATWLGDNSYIIKTEGYTVIHQNNGFILIDSSEKVYVYGSSVNIVSTGNTLIDCGGSFKVKGSKGTLEVS